MGGVEPDRLERARTALDEIDGPLRRLAAARNAHRGLSAADTKALAGVLDELVMAIEPVLWANAASQKGMKG